jgi:hypothetical protein
MSGLDASSGWTALLAGFLAGGAGIGLTNPAIASTAVGVVDPRRAGMAAGINNTFRQVGIATGIAGLGAVFQSAVTSNITDALAHSGAQRPPGARLPPAEVLAQGDPRVLGPLRGAFLTGYTDTLNEILIIGAVIAFVGAVAALVLVRPRDFVPHG